MAGIMGGRGSKRKGAGFERLVAKQILQAAGKYFSRQDCYRTPQSGGHEFAGESDLVMSRRLMRVFPFCVECKHRRGFRIDQLLVGNRGLAAFHKQVRIASRRDTFCRRPLLVIRGNGGSIFACAKIADLRRYDGYLEEAPGLTYYVHGVCWKAITLSELLQSLSVKTSLVGRSGNTK